MNKIHNEKTKLGYLGRKSDNDVTTTISLRSNQNGKFVAIMIISRQYRSGYSTVCVPVGNRGSGIKIFLMFLDKVLPLKKPAQHVPKRSGNEAAYAFQSECDALKANSLIATFSSDSYDWKYLPEDLLDMFEIKQALQIKSVGGRSYLLTFDNSKETELIMYMREFVLWDCKVTFDFWRPGFGALPTSVLQQSNRWIILYGLPLHLLNKFYLIKLCEKFGKVKEVQDLKGKRNGTTALQVLLENCDLTKMPQVIPIVDKGLHFLISVSPHVPEFFGKSNDEDDEVSPRADKASNADVSKPGWSHVQQNIHITQIQKKPPNHAVSTPTHIPKNQPTSPKHKQSINNHYPNPKDFSKTVIQPHRIDTPQISPRFPSLKNRYTTLEHNENADWDRVSTDTEDFFDADNNVSEYISDDENMHNGIKHVEDDSFVKDTTNLANSFGMVLLDDDSILMKMRQIRDELLLDMDSKFKTFFEGLQNITNFAGSVSLNGS